MKEIGELVENLLCLDKQISISERDEMGGYLKVCANVEETGMSQRRNSNSFNVNEIARTTRWTR